MLGSLIKYEVQATGRKILPLYGLVILMAIILKIFIGSSLDNDLSLAISILIYIFAIAAVLIVTLFISVQRFYKNLLGTEGYLMNTLPVPTWMNITSKLLTTTMWNFVGTLIIYASFYIVLYSPEVYQVIGEFGQLFFQVLNFNGSSTGLIIQLIIYMIISSLSGTMMIYTAISIGHLAQSKRILCAFGSYLVLSIFTSIVGSFFTAGETVLDINLVFINSIICNAVLFVAFFAISNYIVGKKLNLE